MSLLMMTKEEALRRLKAAKQTKKDAVAALEEKMKQAYEERTGLKANYVSSLHAINESSPIENRFGEKSD